MSRTRANPLVAGRSDSSSLRSLLKGAQGFSGGSCLTFGESRINLSERGARLLAALAAAPPERVDRVEMILTPESGGGDFVSPEQAAVILGVSRPTVVRWADEGLLADCKVGAHHRFDRGEVQRLRDERLARARVARDAAHEARKAALSSEVDLDVEPTAAELVAAGQALRSGRAEQAGGTLARARRAGARAAAQAAGTPATGS